jgi:hypothetical protein
MFYNYFEISTLYATITESICLFGVLFVYYRFCVNPVTGTVTGYRKTSSFVSDEFEDTEDGSTILDEEENFPVFLDSDLTIEK